MSSWNKNILQIRDSILALKDDLQRAEPKDRLDYVSGIMRCIDFMKQSNIGWASLLSNPSLASQLEKESLENIFLKFREMAIERVDNDVDCINRYMMNLLPSPG
ncbi:MAG: hypothetical protein JRN51_11860 [Nitrososphaerota archaeon]|nr:hypothetical protein [Nitrososphaerota archaeon]MDG6981790.1 hypothetical protein [Nitrososphaerota archaeon]